MSHQFLIGSHNVTLEPEEALSFFKNGEVRHTTNRDRDGKVLIESLPDAGHDVQTPEGDHLFRASWPPDEHKDQVEAAQQAGFELMISMGTTSRWFMVYRYNSTL